ncbi:hypothetical protein TEHAB4_19730 [Tetragenococcus halophilus]|nr:hypothetical protein TEHAB4_19730 [Tetragenococcus halophilus]
MRTWMRKDYLLNTIQDIIGIKTGVLITEDVIFDLTRESKYDQLFGKIKKLDNHEIVTIRGEEFEEIIYVLRIALGNRDDMIAPPLIKWIKEFPEEIDNINKLIEAFSKLVLKQDKKCNFNQEFHEELKREAGTGEIITAAFIFHIVQALDSSITNSFTIEKWDGKIPLRDLFESENLPNKEGEYIDQRFINYLYRQKKDINQIHWRQFEGLVAEFFYRNNYTVYLSSGRNDGGVDVYALKENENTKKPESIIIQCKRYKETNKVEVNVVKALYFDVKDKDVDKALVVTTSYLEPQGKQICDSKKYPINYAEIDKVEKWINEMKSTKNLLYK